MQRERIAAVVVLAMLLEPRAGSAKPLDAGFSETVFLFSDELGGATSMAWAPDGSNRLFVTIKSGPIRIIKNGVLLPPFAKVDPLHDRSECGVLAITFDPDFLHNHYLYVFATVSQSEQQIIRYTAAGDIGTDKTVVLRNLPTAGANHDGGGLGIGPDGKLYWAVGDQGPGIGANGDMRTLAAKVGRANLDGTLPADNPIQDGDGPTNDYIWAAGFRNPFTLTFQPATGLLWLNVVGDLFEQSFIVRRADHGAWNAFENNQPSGYLSPVIAYKTNGTRALALQAPAMEGAVRAAGVTTFRTVQPHFLRLGEKITIAGAEDASFNGDFYVSGVPGGSSFTVAQSGPPARSGSGSATTLYQGGCLTGGAFYDATQFPPAYRGNFFYGDFNSNRIMRATIDAATNTVTSVDYWATDIPFPVDAEVGPDAALYYLGHGGRVHRTTYNASAQGLVVTPANLWTAEGLSAAVNVRLAQPVAQDLTVSVARSAGDSAVGVVSGSTLTFTAANWSVPQAATLAIDPDDDSDDEEATLTVAAGGMAAQTVTVHVRDIDSPALVLSASALGIDEGATGTFTVALAQQPSATVIVHVTVSAGDPDVTVSTGRTLTFTSASWSMPQTVTLAVAEDADATDDRTTISVTPAGRTGQSLVVTTRDNDPASADAAAEAGADGAGSSDSVPPARGDALPADAGPPDAELRIDAGVDAAADAVPVDGPSETSSPPLDAGVDLAGGDRSFATEGSPPDAPDGAQSPPPDARGEVGGNDAGAPGAQRPSGGGCSCRVGGPGGGGGGFGALALVLALAACSRRRAITSRRALGQMDGREGGRPARQRRHHP
jgi:MYXO-CTERM domain-containing protein